MLVRSRTGYCPKDRRQHEGLRCASFAHDCPPRLGCRWSQGSRGVGSGETSSGPIPPACSAREGLDLFSHDLLQEVPVQHEIGDDLQLGVLVAQRSELAQLGQAQPAELLLPSMERLLADAQPAIYLGDFLAAFDLMQGVNEFLVAATFAASSAFPRSAVELEVASPGLFCGYIGGERQAKRLFPAGLSPLFKVNIRRGTSGGSKAPGEVTGASDMNGQKIIVAGWWPLPTSASKSDWSTGRARSLGVGLFLFSRRSRGTRSLQTFEPLFRRIVRNSHQASHFTGEAAQLGRNGVDPGHDFVAHHDAKLQDEPEAGSGFSQSLQFIPVGAQDFHCGIYLGTQAFEVVQDLNPQAGRFVDFIAQPSALPFMPDLGF